MIFYAGTLMNKLNGKNGVSVAAGVFHLERIQRRLAQFKANHAPLLKPGAKQIGTAVNPICSNRWKEPHNLER